MHQSTVHRVLVRHRLNRLDHLDRMTRVPIRRFEMSTTRRAGPPRWTAERRGLGRWDRHAGQSAVGLVDHPRGRGRAGTPHVADRQPRGDRCHRHGRSDAQRDLRRPGRARRGSGSGGGIHVCSGVVPVHGQFCPIGASRRHARYRGGATVGQGGRGTQVELVKIMQYRPIHRVRPLAGVLLVLLGMLGVGAIGSASVGTGTAGAAVSHADTGSAWWVPSLGSQPWQWELTNPLNLSDAEADGDRRQAARREPGPGARDLRHRRDHQPRVHRGRPPRHGQARRLLHRGGCGGQLLLGRRRRGSRPPTTHQLQAAGVLGKSVPGWPEHYLDIRSPATLSIIESMIDQQCAAKGFDAVETDIDESYDSNTGFPLTLADEEQYMTTLADYMHGLGLGWWIKNPDDTGSPTLRHRHGAPGRCRADRAVQPVQDVHAAQLLLRQEGRLQRRVPPEAGQVLLRRRCPRHQRGHGSTWT